MRKAVLISIKPEWCELIASRKKTVEVRKSIPKLDTPFKCYIYCTKSTLSDQLWVLSKNERKENFGLSAVCANLNATAEICRGNGKVIGEFVCDDITKFAIDPKFDNLTLMSMANRSCLSKSQLEDYCSDYWLYGWHISDLKIYDKPRELSEFKGLRTTKFGYEPVEIKRPPQSWCYVEEGEENA